jgi:hypothetical protein
MNDELELLREARPAAAAPSLELVERARADLMRAIRRSASPWRARRRAVVGVPVVAAMLAAVALGTTMLTRGGDAAWAAALVKVAESVPRLLPGEQGWQVSRADQFNIDFGEVTFTRGQAELELRWQPASAYQATLRKRTHDAGLTSAVVIAGTNARVFRDRSTDLFSAVWKRSGYAVEIRGTARDIEDFESTLGSFHEVDVDAWLSAMPANVVKPSSRSGVVNQMLADVPLPSGFNVDKLRTGDTVRDRYQLGAEASGAVGCAWIGQWLSAQQAGDHARARQATNAMATSRHWVILREMKAEGNYPDVFWQYAAAMTTNQPVLGKATVAQSYMSALGCPVP